MGRFPSVSRGKNGKWGYGCEEVCRSVYRHFCPNPSILFEFRGEVYQLKRADKGIGGLKRV